MIQLKIEIILFQPKILFNALSKVELIHRKLTFLGYFLKLKQFVYSGCQCYLIRIIKICYIKVCTANFVEILRGCFKVYKAFIL